MELLVHDLPETPAAWEKMPERTILSPQKPIHRCVGCFGCWVKTPGCCVIPDAYQDLGPVLGHCDHLILISRCVYGTFSPFVKNVIDRSLAYMHPYFSV